MADYLHYLSSERTRADAENEAKKIKADGEQVYEIPLDEWHRKLGDDGKRIYDFLRKSDYGFVG